MKIAHKFYLRDTDDTQKKTPIYLQLTYNRKNTKRAIGFDCTKSEWNENSWEAKNNYAANTRINELRQNINDLQYKMQKEGLTFNLTQLADLIFNKESTETLLTVYFEQYIENALKSKKIGLSTHKHYKTCLKYLREFAKTVLKADDINIQHVDYPMIEKFHLFLHAKGIESNSINSNQHKKLKTALNHAINQGIIKSNPYANFKFKTNPTHRDFLTLTELRVIMDANLGGNESLERVRDLFLFSCHTGLRFTDSQNLKAEHIREDSSSSFIYREQTKTGETVHIPLSSAALSILAKYDTVESRIIQRVLPQISNQKLNSYLKTI